MILIVTAQFNAQITHRLQTSAIEHLEMEKQSYKVIEVPGAVELPITVQTALKTGKYQAAITLGCVIKGDTDHYEMVIRSATDGLSRVSLDLNIPVIQGVLACKNFDQAWARQNLGKDYAETAIAMIKTLKTL